MNNLTEQKMNNKYKVREENSIKENITDYLKRHEEKDMLRFLTAGSVDDGKSTLIGRLLYDSQMIYEDQLNSVLKDSKVYGTTDDEFDPALLTDGLKAEREQGITIDVAYRYFSTEKRSFIICDSPGHEQYTRNMATGASHCNLAIILIDARNGVMPQTKRHSFISSLLGINHFIIAVNKMDAVDYSEQVFRKIRRDYESFAAKLDTKDIHFIPISALKGDNVVNRSENMEWYDGAPLLSTLEEIQIVSDRNLIDFRFPVQYVLRPNLNFRGFAGTIASGTVRKGDKIVSLPSGQQTEVNQIITFDGDNEEAFAPQSVVLTTKDEIDISRGCVLSRTNNTPAVGSNFDADIVWMSEDEVNSGKRFTLKTSTQAVPATLSKLRYKFDVNTLHRQNADELKLNDIARVEVKSHRPLCFDFYKDNKQTGAFILIDNMTNATVAAGMIIQASSSHIKTRTHIGTEPVSKNIYKEKTEITPAHREKLLGHKASTVWLTGLSGSGKSTIARALENKLIELGISAFILDGDNIRHGLNKDLGFSGEDRTENIRRIAEVAKLMNDAGIIVITSFISPFIKDREQAKMIIGKNRFFETSVIADLETCRLRDPKGLYNKAAKGEITNFTGIDSPYEEPEQPVIELDTRKKSVEKSVDIIVSELKYNKIIP
ncbi:MAG: sulfate adenylyltransferase subunit CysN [Victivallales bacterium]|nr:sulfate adenylyltransferase subunit CysN [Victivallales bacterium]